MAGFFDRFRQPPTPPGPLDQDTVDNALGLVRAGRKIVAIKLVRERTGLGLAEAKGVVDAIEEGRRVPVEPGPGSLADRVRELLGRDRVADAIVLVAGETGMTEAEAARFIDALDR
ncbi:ribosomal protein L7/L12 [Nocardiopsis sp. N85]|uniref:ribosomal protein L7/L12 n=1 Tax=Nocardiopsis sp. N85 TaxID=3029400 RepID=UPI00237F6C1D|nr:ribosomal protein L7/L12 [Nocardiopsis sp. N85]MDE3724490.1 ribosomal protein L7/L12 [Nocardiopsis sp. N85]